MVLEEDPATNGGGEDGGTGPPEHGPQAGQGDQGTGAPKETEMALDHQEGLGAEEHSGVVQELPIRLPALERRRQLDFVSTVAHILLIAQALGGISSKREGPQMDQGESNQRSNRQESQQEGSGQLAPQEEPGQRSDSQAFIPLNFAQAQSGEGPEAGKFPCPESRCAGQERSCKNEWRRSSGNRGPPLLDAKAPSLKNCLQKDRQGKWPSAESWN